MSTNTDVNPIKCLIQTHFDSESFTKFQIILDYLGKDTCKSLYKKYNDNLQEATKMSLEEHELHKYLALKGEFYLSCLIGEVSKLLLDRYRRGDDKAHQNFIALAKILVYHVLTSKFLTVNFALVQLDQMCLDRNTTLECLYNEHKPKFLRLTIKAILERLNTITQTDQSSGESSTSGSQASCMVWPYISNRVISYMFRALDIFNIKTVSDDDVAHSLIIITNLIHKEIYDDAIRIFLEHLARYQDKDICKLIRLHIQAILVSLLFKKKLSHFDMTQSLNRLCSFCDKKLEDMLKDMDNYSNIKAQLLLNFSIDRRSVTDGIYYLSKYEKKLNEQPFEDEFDDEQGFIDYIKDSMIGILLGIDSYLMSTKKDFGKRETIKHIESLHKILSNFTSNDIEAIHVKLMSTMCLLIALRPTRDNKELNTAIKDLWSVFVSKLSQSFRSTLVIKICVSLYDLMEDSPGEICDIFDLLICKAKPSLPKDVLQSLFFIPNVPEMAGVYNYLSGYLETCANSIQELQTLLDYVYPLMKYESQKAKLLALTRIKQLLWKNQTLLSCDMLINPDEPLNCVISKIIETLLSNSSTQDVESSAIIAECLGLLGAVNPIRLDHLIYGELDDNNSVTVTNLSDPKFIVELIERLGLSLSSDQTSLSEAVSYALQKIVDNYSVVKDARYREKLSESSYQACLFSQNTNYELFKRNSQPDTSCSVFEKFKSEGQYSYREWLDKFSRNIASSINDPKIQKIFNACSYVFKYSLKLAEYLLPHAIIHIILHEPAREAIIIKREILSIVQEEVGFSTQDLDTSGSEDVRCSIETLHFQCSNMVFCLLDAIYKLDCELRGLRPQLTLPERQKNSVSEFLASIPKDKLAILAAKCRSHARALCYLERHLFENKIQLNNYATTLQRIYVALDDTYEAAGVDMIRTTPTAIADDIANFEACGRFDKAFTCCITSLESFDTQNSSAAYRINTQQTRKQSQDRGTLLEDALRCLSNQGDYERLYEKSRHLIQELSCSQSSNLGTSSPSNVGLPSQYKRHIMPYAIEANWKLSKWDELHELLYNDQYTLDNLIELAPVGQGSLLDSLIMLNDKRQVLERLKTVRNRLMKPLSIAMSDRSAYFRGYENMIVLHSLFDFSMCLRVVDAQEINNFALANCKQPDHNNIRKLVIEPNKLWPLHVDENNADIVLKVCGKNLDTVFDLWNRRSKLVQTTLRSLEPITAWQRSCSLALAKKYPILRDKINIHVGQLWISSADSAREARSFDRSFYCLTQARRWFGNEFDKLNLSLRLKYYIEQAKLDWDQGEQTKAIRGLRLTVDRLKDHELCVHLRTRQSKNQSADPFPQLNNLKPCDRCNSIDMSERKSFAEIKMLLTHYCEVAAAGIPETLFFMYEECVHLGVNQEETYFRLARYYDKLLAYYMENPKLCGEQAEERQSLIDSTQRLSQKLMSGDKDLVYTKLMEHSIIAFGNSLKYGVRYIRESMPRMLNIWYDLGSKKATPGGQPGAAQSIRARIESTVRFIDDLKTRGLPAYYFMTAISILLSRVSHPHSGVSKKTCEILELLLTKYPHQITWLMVSLILHIKKGETDDRGKAAKSILCNPKIKKSHVEKIVLDTFDFSRVLVELCTNHGPNDRSIPEGRKKKLTGKVNIKEITPSVSKCDFSSMRVVVPIQATIRPIIPMDMSAYDDSNHDKHVVFPEQNNYFVKSFDSQVRIFNSLQQPRQVTLHCESGKTASILCKSGDDLRKDSRCIEFLNLLNSMLRRDSQANARFLDIQTFLVLPLKCDAGIIEMVPNCESLRNTIDALYKERKPNFVIHDQIPKKCKDYQPAELVIVFENQVLPKVSPPVLPLWFLRKFNEPTSWYMAKLAFTRSCAVISMGGYIIGLGDRHLDNILIDTQSGKVVHVDFNLLFHQGETLPTPERVPFRLTQNIVASFGPVGTEGNFRKISEITMRVMRKEKEALLTTLKPFMHDPCSEWIKVRDTARVQQKGANNQENPVDKHAENQSAKIRIEIIERKLKGFPRSREFKPLTLIDSYSVEAQVDNLIAEATDNFNLAQMYYGWCPHI